MGILKQGIAAVIVVFLVGCGLVPAQAHAAADVPEAAQLHELEESLERAVDDAGVPGGTIALVTADGVDVGAAGTDADGNELDADARMLWGSVGKPLAAASVVRLAGEGRLDLDDRAIEHVPELREQRDPGVRSITIRQLLKHTSGLPFGAEHLDVDDAERKPAEVIAGLPQISLLDRPGQSHSYSSLGYVLVQAVAEKASGVGLSRLESRYFPGVGQTEALSPGARFIGDFAISWPSPRDGAGLGYGYQGGPVDALGGFVQWGLSDDGAEVIDEMVAQPVDTGGNGGMGMGLRLRDDGVVWHSGTAPGYFSAMHLDRERGVGVVTTMNASGMLHEEELLALSERLFDEARGVGGDGPADAGSPTPVLIVLAIAAIVAAAITVGFTVRARRRWVVVWMLAAVAIAGLGWWLLPELLGARARHVWLWIPSIGVGFVLLPLVFAGVAVWWWIRGRRGGRIV
ncbi:serine hydrolase domain-containing protein [Brevibacterium zhoupengii]|uniref:serine hydrolase domain-containing protein n=1 Tax=Brevibacterium zhoupengii TaxID=2898795 RepID=UPI001E2E5252|nr:serine hydrolase domain-containing protein [Brevibacterium zhoupengii]